MHQIRFAPGLCLGPRWGSSRRSPDLPSRMGRRYPSPYPSRSTPSASRSRRLLVCHLNLFFVPARLSPCENHMLVTISERLTYVVRTRHYGRRRGYPGRRNEIRLASKGLCMVKNIQCSYVATHRQSTKD